MSARRRLGALATVGLLAVTVGCGGGDDGGDSGGRSDGFAGASAQEKVDTARKAMADLHAVHLNGTLSNAGQSVDVDLHLDSDGRCLGSFSISGGVAEVRAVDGSAWMRPDAAVWKAFAGDGAEQVQGFVGDKWVVLEDAQLAEMCDFDSIMDSLVTAPDEDRTYSEDGTEDVEGERAFKITTTGADGEGFGYVRADAPHYLLRTELGDGETPATMTFSDFDGEVDVEAPAADDVIDLSRMTS